MQLTRTVLTIAFAAGTASALPTCKPGDCVDAQARNGDNVEAIPSAYEKRMTRGFAQHLQVKNGIQPGASDENYTSNHSVQGDAARTVQSLGAPRMMPPAYEAVTSADDKRRERMIHAVKTPESQFDGQGPAPSSPYYDKTPSPQRGPIEDRLHNGNGVNHRPKVGAIDRIQIGDNPEGAQKVNHANPSTKKMGFTLRVRELFRLFTQDHNEGQMHPDPEQEPRKISAEQEDQQQQVSTRSISIRQDTTRAQASPNQRPLDDMGNTDYDQEQGRGDSNPKLRSTMYQEVSRVSVPLSLPQNNLSTRSHMGLSNAHGQQQQQGAEQEDNQENQQHAHDDPVGQHMEPQMQQQQQQQQGMKQMDNQQTMYPERHPHPQEMEQNNGGEEQRALEQQMTPESDMTACVRAAMGDVDE